MGRKKERVDVSGASSGGFGALGSALSGLGFTSTEPAAPERALSTIGEQAPVSVDDLSDVPKVVLRLERAGRRGKSVTVVEKLPTERLAAAAASLKKDLGCGVNVEGDGVVVQGDQRARVAAWLTDRGVRTVRQ